MAVSFFIMEELLKIFNIKSEEDFKVKILEMLGNLVLMSHWQRGIIDALIREGNIELDEKQKNNWDRVIGSLSHYEQYIWEIVPSRALLPIMRHFRLTGELIDNFEILSKQDEHGRVAYDLTERELDDIEDVFRRISDARETAIQVGDYGHANSLLNPRK